MVEGRFSRKVDMGSYNGHKRTSRRRVLGMAGLAAAAPALGVGTARAVSGPEGTVAPSGAWCWFGDPRVLHHENRTYIGFITNNPDGTGDITIAQYDHDTNQLTSSVVRPGFPRDDHNNPAICIRPDGRVVAFYTGHQQAELPMHYVRSKVAGDINGGWEPVKHITTNTPGSGWTYANLAQLSAEPNKLYVFWRGGNFNPTYSTTTGGDVWTEARNFIYYDLDGTVHRPYVKVYSDGVDTIHFAFTQGHPRDVLSSIFYMYYRGGNLYRANGDLIGPWGEVIRPGRADKVYNADDPNDDPGPKAWVWDVAADADGHPVIVYANFPTDTDHRYRYARWNGTEWIDNEITPAGNTISEDTREPNYSGGISLDHADPSVVVLSRQEPGGRHEVERWTTNDNGQSWTSEPITQNSSELNVRPFVPVGLTGTGAMSVLWMAGEYPSYTTDQTRIMALDENGEPFSLLDRLQGKG
jgi:BNR repeat-containing family member